MRVEGHVTFAAHARYELVSETSNKVWEIVLKGAAFETRYGRIGTPGRVSKKEFPSAALAQAAYDRIIGEKVREGYRLASTAASPAEPDAAPARPAQPSEPPARDASLAPDVINQLSRLGATIDGAYLEPVPVAGPGPPANGVPPRRSGIWAYPTRGIRLVS